MNKHIIKKKRKLNKNNRKLKKDKRKIKKQNIDKNKKRFKKDKKKIPKKVYNDMLLNNSNKSPFVFAFLSIRSDIDKLNNLDFLVSNFNKKLSPLSGSEPKYEPEKWNNNSKIKSTHNCYSYVMNQIVSKRKGKPQPGYFALYNSISNKEYKDCKSFYKRMKKDTPHLYLSSFDKPCRKGFSKGFIAVSNLKGKDTDYHFWRQDSNGLWSHKPGATDVVNVDADGKNINNPYLANRNYGRLYYNKPCYYFCRPHRFTKTSSV